MARPSLPTSSSDFALPSDRDRMSTDTPPSSGSENPPPPPPPGRARRRSPPLTPPRRRASEAEPMKLRRLSHPAVFQRLLASGTELAAFPSPRHSHDRGRFPEEARSENGEHGSESDDDSDEEDNNKRSWRPPRTPAGSVCGDELTMGVSESPGAGSLMDVDMPSVSPSVSSMSVSSTPAHQWRSTPPPTQSVVRTNKRKRTLDDRYDPYPSAAKRRAASPSLVRAGSPSFMRSVSPYVGRGVSPHLHSPRATPRMPLAIPKSIPGSSCSSAAALFGGAIFGGSINGGSASGPNTSNAPSGMASCSSSSSMSTSTSFSGPSANYAGSPYASPSTHSGPGLAFARPAGMTASPTLRTSMGLASPILRPVVRSWLREEEEPEVEGAGERVNGLSLGER
ncbi:hypothetical protein BD626DRAFT_486214 [Schizophyllum amplum]|uniref:Uncharacterized protein n=1 Tax=Schizophyllum amplum TaxID=97359 RepID=A0A550CMD1_9AGAR|nr:hypothetical protein BD626DRAFT_486214 [Auriculariopsis ampla]